MINEELILFITDMKEKLQNDQMSENEMQMLGEFYMLCKFKNEFEMMKDEIEERDLIKFLVLGWYCYCLINANKKSQL
jgi:hypothetical protein